LTDFEQVLKEREAMENDRRRILKQDEEIQKKILAAETPQLGAAVLQDIVRQLSEKNSINLRSFRILEPKDLGVYRRISVQIDFNPTPSMKNLSKFLYELEHHEKSLMISEMDLLIFNPRMANNIQGNVVVSALMKGTKFKEQGKEEKAAKGEMRREEGKAPKAEASRESQNKMKTKEKIGKKRER
jgi:hypothetical protein